MSTHENWTREEDVVGPSDRSFGLLFAIVFAVAGLLPLWRGGPVRLWALVVGAAFAVIALARPRVLAPANQVWLKVGLLLHRIVNPVVLGALFYGVVTPFGLVVRAAGKGLARRLRADRGSASYWIARRDAPSPMDRPF